MIQANGSVTAFGTLQMFHAGRARIAAQMYAITADVRQPAARKEPSATTSIKIVQLATAVAHGAHLDIVIAHKLCILMDLSMNP